MFVISVKLIVVCGEAEDWHGPQVCNRERTTESSDDHEHLEDPHLSPWVVEVVSQCVNFLVCFEVVSDSVSEPLDPHVVRKADNVNHVVVAKANSGEDCVHWETDD